MFSFDIVGDFFEELFIGKEFISNKEIIEDGGFILVVFEVLIFVVVFGGDVDGN